MKKIFITLTFLFTIAWTSTEMFAEIKSEINSYGEFDVRGKKYYIVPAAGEDATDVEFKTYVPYLEYALHLNGAIAGSKYNYDILVALDYDIEDASYEYHYSTPVYGETSIQSAKTKFYNDNTAVTKYKYNTGVVGYQTHYEVVNQWTRYAAVYIYTKEGSDRIMQWKGYVESTGKLDRLIEVFPAMMFTLSRVLGQRVTDYWHRENDDFVDNYFANGKLYIEGYKPVKYTHVTKQDYRHRLIPEYIKQDYNRTTILFSTWSKKNGDYYAIRLGQDTYISCNNQRYKMLSSSITPEKRTIVDVKNVDQYVWVTFERIPDDANNFRIVSNVDGHIEWQWDNVYYTDDTHSVYDDFNRRVTVSSMNPKAEGLDMSHWYANKYSPSFVCLGGLNLGGMFRTKPTTPLFMFGLNLEMGVKWAGFLSTLLGIDLNCDHEFDEAIIPIYADFRYEPMNTNGAKPYFYWKVGGAVRAVGDDKSGGSFHTGLGMGFRKGLWDWRFGYSYTSPNRYTSSSIHNIEMCIGLGTR